MALTPEDRGLNPRTPNSGHPLPTRSGVHRAPSLAPKQPRLPIGASGRGCTEPRAAEVRRPDAGTPAPRPGSFWKAPAVENGGCGGGAWGRGAAGEPGAEVNKARRGRVGRRPAAHQHALEEGALLGRQLHAGHRGGGQGLLARAAATRTAGYLSATPRERNTAHSSGRPGMESRALKYGSQGPPPSPCRACADSRLGGRCLVRGLRARCGCKAVASANTSRPKLSRTFTSGQCSSHPGC